LLESNPANDFYAVGEQIRLKREAIGMTQKELAEKAGIDDKSICRLKLEQSRMRLDTFFNIACSLGVSPNDISPLRFSTSAAESPFASLEAKYNLLTPEQKHLVLRTLTTMVDVMFSQQ